MQTIVFIGCNKSGTSRDALSVSAEMGYYTVLLTDRREFLQQRDEFPEVHEMVFVEDLLNKEMIFHFLAELNGHSKQVKTVTSFIDPFVSYSAQIAAEMGLGQLSVLALMHMEDKTRFREKLKGLTVSPKHFSIHLSQPISHYLKEFEGELPLILKSPSSNGSKDVLYAASSEELKSALSYFQKKFPEKPILLEEYLQGPQYLIEVMVHEGTMTIAAVVEQEIEYKVRFIVTGYLYPAPLSEFETEKLTAAISDIISRLGLMNGNCHLEMRFVNDQWKLIEINPRMAGGAMNKIIYSGTGINLVKETLKLTLGQQPEIEKKYNKFAFAKFITIQSQGRLVKVTGKERALSYSGVTEVYIKPRKGAFLTKPYSLGDRYAYCLAVATTAEEAKNIALQAAGEIKFYLEPL